MMMGLPPQIPDGLNPIQQIQTLFLYTAGTIAKIQQTVTVEGEAAELAARGRHDACVLPRAVPMVEAMVNLVICDHLLRQHGQNVLP